MARVVATGSAIVLLVTLGSSARRAVGAETDTPVSSPPAARRIDTEVGAKRVDLPRGETTEVHGTIDENISGYWLVAAVYELPRTTGRVYPILELYSIEKCGSDALEVHWHAFRPPASVQTKLATAQSAQAEWWPDTGDIATVTNSLSMSRPQIDRQLRAGHTVSAADQFDTEMKKTPASEGAIFAISSFFQPDDRVPYGQSYFVSNQSAGELSGRATMGAVPIASHGMPHPVGMQGRFRWIRLTPPGTSHAPGLTAPACKSP